MRREPPLVDPRAADRVRSELTPVRAPELTGAIPATGGGRGRRCIPTRRRLPRIRRQKSPGFAARTIARASSATGEKRLWPSAGNRRDEVPLDRGPPGCVAGARHVRWVERFAVRL